MCCKSTYLLIQIFQFIPRKFKLRNLWQNCVPSPTVYVGDKRLNAIHSVQRYLALALERLKGLVQRIFFTKLKHNLDHTETKPPD